MPSICYESKSGSMSVADIRHMLMQSLENRTITKALIIPPDATRPHSGAGEITAMYYELLSAKGIHADILPALGTHSPMTRSEQLSFFGNIPVDRFLTHSWRDGVTTIGEVPSSFVCDISDGLMTESIPVQVSDYLLDPSYDVILSVGQVVPHEVVGMANYTKNIVIGCGGSRFISASHMLGAVYGIERILGHIDTPVRKLLDYAEENFLLKLPIVYVLTVTETNLHNTDIVGLYIGHGDDKRNAFEQAAALSQQRNITYVDQPIRNCIVWLDKDEFQSMWLGNKAVYRTRMAMADGGQLLVLAPGIKTFGEDPENDRLIRKYGYTGRRRILKLCKSEPDLQHNMSAAAHLIHGSPEGRFQIIYAAPQLGREAIESVGYRYMDIEKAIQQYGLHDHENQDFDNKDFYFIRNPALGLWATKLSK